MAKNSSEKVKAVLDKLDGKIVLTEDELKLCKEACIRTYQYIGDELPENSSTSLIMEVVLDASRVRSHGRLSEELFKKFDNWVTQEIDEYQKTLGWKATMNRLAKVLLWSR